MSHRGCLTAAVAAVLLLAGTSASAQSDERRALEEVRNTVINLLEALVQKGVMTREQAEQMVAQAQQKATTDANARATQDAAEKDAVRVTYVPEIVRKQISDEVGAGIKDDVAKQVVAEAQSQGWGVPGALPSWVKGVRLHADVRTRAQSNLYSEDNAVGAYLDINKVNEAGGIGLAGQDALLNTTEDRHTLVGRLRTGFIADLGNAVSIEGRLTSGNAITPVSTNQTLGQYGSRWNVGVDRAAVLWNPINRDRTQEFDLRFGRFANPFPSYSELIFDNDLSFEGLSMTYAADLFGGDAERMERGLFLTVGAFPLQEEELSKDDKWLYAGRLGAEFTFGGQSTLLVAAGYFMYDNITGVRNSFESTLYDFTAPSFLQKGNTLFDIRNDEEDDATNLFALAGEYEIANASLWLDLGFGQTHVIIGGEYVKNLGWKTDDVLQRTQQLLDERVEAYDAMLIVGRPHVTALWDWRYFASYRYVERDAVLDAFTDSDFRLGGTDAKGYQFGFDLGLSRGAWLRLRYITANEIDGPPLGIDVWQLDLNGQF